MTITEFLLARIGEDEAAAERGGYHNGAGTFANDNYGCMLIQPARVLAECAAKRDLIEVLSAPPTEDIHAAWMSGTALRCMAAVYAGHPGYSPEWA